MAFPPWPLSTPRVLTCLAYIFVFSSLMVGASAGASGQSQNPSSSTTSALTPSGMSPGSPAGSYALSGFDNVNLFNGNMNLRLPLLTVGGRGSAAYTMMLATNTKKWQVRTDMAHESDNPLCVLYQEYDYVGHLIRPYVCRHSLDVDRFTPLWKQWNPIEVGYSPGVMQGRKAGVGTIVRKTCDNCPIICARTAPMYRYTLTRLTFIAPDGTEYELRDEASGGQPRIVDHARCNDFSNQGAFRGRRFISADGSAMTFVADQDIYDDVRVPTGPAGAWLFSPSGVLYMRDGTSYRIDSGRVSWIRDRNGNKITFNYDTTTEITDSLNRKITIEYNQTEEPYGLHDRITYRGFAGASRVIRVAKTTLSAALRAPYTIRTFPQLFPELNGSQDLYSSINPANQDFNPPVVSAVWLPDGRKYQFLYNSYAEVARVELPTGGAMEYDMVDGSGVIVSSGAAGSGIEERQIYRRLNESRVYAGPTAATLISKTRYTLSSPVDGNVVKVERLDGANHLLGLSKHYFNGSAAESLFTRELGSLYSPAGEGREIITESLNPSDQTTVIQRITNTWAQREAVAWVGQLESYWPNYPLPGLNIQPENNPRLTETITTIEPAGANLVSKRSSINPGDNTVGFDQYNNQTDLWEYGFGVGAVGELKRHTHTTYVTGASYTDANSPHLVSLPAQTSVFDANEIERSRTSFEYDNYNVDTYHAGLISRGNISGWDDSYGASFSTRGNVTATAQYLLNTSGAVTGSVSAYAQYDVAGNPVKVIDARGYATSFDFRDNFGAPDGQVESSGEPVNSPPSDLAGQNTYAFPFKVTNALGHVSYAQFDYYLGRAVDGEDANGIVSSGYFNDLLDRPTQVIRAANDLSAKNQTTFVYDDSARTITTKSDQTTFDDRLLKTELVYDGLGQTIETRQYENANDYIAVRNVPSVVLQDGGNWLAASQTSNPFRPYLNEQPVWSTSFADTLGRIIKVKTPDNAVVATFYFGNTVTVTDQAGRKRRSTTDGLGRLVRVDEPDIHGNLDVNGAPAQATSYSYDVLDSLIEVNQGGQIRTFSYDSLKRLLLANNPESGVTCYGRVESGQCQYDGYDPNGNLIYKTDARHIRSTFTYDALNRNTSVTYSDNTPAVYRYYDSSVNGKGRLTWEDTWHVSARIFDAYDAQGRPTQYRQRFWVNGAWGNNFTVTAAYDKAGKILTLGYPSGHSVNYNYDGAGRLADKDGQHLAFTGNLGDGTPRTYSAANTYSSFGGLTQEQFGTTTPLFNKRHYNVRGQLYDLRLSTASLTADEWNWNRGAILNWYDTTGGFQSQNPNSGTDNNGNLLRQEVYVPNNDQVSSYNFRRQNYSYDSLNRLTAVSEYANGATPTFAQSYTYDRWGNRTIDMTPTKSWGTGISNKNLGVSTTNNRLTVPSGQSGALTYDDAGNLINDSYTGDGAREYDAENRMYRAWANNQWQTYTYDSDGKRVKRVVNGTETWQVYGLGGELLAEYAANAPYTSPKKEYGYRNGELLITAEAPAGPPVNLALNKTATQSSDPGWGGPAGKAVDGNTDGQYFNGSVTATNNDAQAWWQVDLGGTHFVQNVEVWNRTDCCADRLTNFNVILLDANQAVVSTVNVAGLGGMPTTVPIAGTARYVKVQLAGTNYLSLAEVKVWGAAAPPATNGYTYQRTLTIDHTKVPNTDQSNFPVLVSGTYSYLASIANGGSVQNANGYDVIFTSDAGCSTKLDHEVETYNPSTGAVNYWVKVPTVSHTTDTAIYICYGNASITTDQSNRNGVWNSSYKGVWHLNDNAASTTVADSTNQATNGTSTANTNARTVSGKTSNGLAFNGSDDRVAIGNGVVDANGDFTISAWAYIADTSHNAYSIMGGTVPGSIWGYFILIHRADKGGLTFQYDVNGNGALFTTPSANMTATTWTHVVLVRDRANGHVKIYQNGVQITDAAINPSFNNSTSQGWAFGSWAATWAANTWNGRLDEVRLSATARSADWVTAEYNNQNSPSTFYTISEASGGAAATAGIHWLVTDHLGTPRIILDQTGSLATVSRHDYLPFGEELFAGTGGRTVAQGYTANDNVRQKFTSKERDGETGLDYFGARYYTSSQGRFSSIDPKMLTTKRLVNPQRWNHYAYVLNNPLTLYDPDGREDQGKGGGRVIDIFLTLDPKLGGVDRMTQDQQRRFDRVIAQGQRQGLQFNVRDGFNDTAEEAATAVGTKGRIVLFGVHSSQDQATKQYLGIATDTGTLGRRGIIYTNDEGKYEVTATPPPQADLVVAMTCQSAFLAAQFRGVGNYVGVKGEPSTMALNEALIASLEVIVKANGTLNAQTIEDIRAASEGVIRNNPLQKNPDPTVDVVVNPQLLPPTNLELNMIRKGPME